MIMVGGFKFGEHKDLFRVLVKLLMDMERERRVPDP